MGQLKDSFEPDVRGWGLTIARCVIDRDVVAPWPVAPAKAPVPPPAPTRKPTACEFVDTQLAGLSIGVSGSDSIKTELPFWKVSVAFRSVIRPVFVLVQADAALVKTPPAESMPPPLNVNSRFSGNGPHRAGFGPAPTGVRVDAPFQ